MLSALNAELKFNSKKDLILSAGAVNTPKLLELSGIDDSDILISLGIKVVMHSPMVGKIGKTLLP